MNQPISKKQRKASRFYNAFLKRGEDIFVFREKGKRVGRNVSLPNNAGKQNLLNNLAQIQLPQKKG